jgi:hypothetical protein
MGRVSEAPKSVGFRAAEVIASVREHPFSCFSKPFALDSLAAMIRFAAESPCWDQGIRSFPFSNTVLDPPYSTLRSDDNRTIGAVH